MFGGGEEDSGGLFSAAPTTAAASANPRVGAKPLVSNGLFGGEDLKDDDPPVSKGGNSKLNSIFDYEVDDGEEEEKANAYNAPQT